MAASPAAAVEMRSISKRFGGVRALDGVDFAVRFGEIHALLGENGAGKSTILKILQGVLRQDEGEILVSGERVGGLTPRTANALGVGMIFQELSLVPTLTVAQNIYLGREPLHPLGLIDDGAMVRGARELFEGMGVKIDPRQQVGDLSAGQQQLTEIAKTLSRTVRVLILDEPTSALSNADVEILFGLLRRLREAGNAIIYVSHRMDEIFRIADTVTVLRDGTRVATRPIAEYTLESLITDIMGKASREMSAPRGGVPGRREVVLRLSSVGVRGREGTVDLELHEGEVLGLAGLMGSGRSRIARCLFGLEPEIEGRIELHGKTVQVGHPADGKWLGLALVPEDRRRQGLVLEHSIEDNVALPVLDRVSGAIFVNSGRRAAAADEAMSRLAIKADGRRAPVMSLSGGNQQKVVIGKWLAAEPVILVMDEPTAGIDIGSKTEIVRLVRELAAAGKSIIFISSELSELLAVSDRIAVMRRGSVARILRREDLEDPDTAAATDNVLRDAEKRLQFIMQQGEISA